jgi:hypothetical protein
MMPASGDIEVLSLRRVAARFLARNEQDGLDELDEITSAVFGKIRMRYLLWLVAVSVATVIFGGAIVVAIAGAIAMSPQSDAFTAAALFCAVILGAILLLWRLFQYGIGFARVPRAAMYPDPDKISARNLDRFFSVVQRETSPRAFFYTASGTRRFLDRHYFFGSLRTLLLAEHRWVREPVFSPQGMWFGQEVFLEADVAALIAQARARPRATGRPKTYDYTDAVMSLIEHPEIGKIEPGKRGDQTRVLALLEGWYVAKRVTPPSEGQLRLYAQQVLDVIRKNRARSG